jgi:hypothetical protein
MKEREISILGQTEIWKSPMENFNCKMSFYGSPYYEITRENNVYYLWELDKENPDSNNYHLMKTSDDFEQLYEEGMALNRAIESEIEKKKKKNLSKLNINFP